MTGYQLLRLELPAELEDELAAELWERGSLGLEVKPAGAGRVALEAYFPERWDAEGLDLGRWRRLGVTAEGPARLEERDWLAAYRARAVPFELGRRFRIDPRDPDEPAAASVGETGETGGERILLRIPARTAFGTGSHETTRLVLAFLEDLELAGRDVLDLGTGSGILAFAALALGARSVVAIDADPQAVLIAGRNRVLNPPGEPLLAAARLAALRPRPRFDLALVNVLPERVLGEVGQLVALLRPGAEVISSGNLESRRGEVLAALARHRLRAVEERRDGEWIAFRLHLGEGP